MTREELLLKALAVLRAQSKRDADELERLREEYALLRDVAAAAQDYVDFEKRTDPWLSAPASYRVLCRALARVYALLAAAPPSESPRP